MNNKDIQKSTDLYKPPFYFDENNYTVKDSNGFHFGENVNQIVGAIIVDALNQYWNRSAEIDLLNKQIEELRNVCTEAYVLAGAYDANDLALDNLFAASNGDPIPHESFLPWVEDESFAKYQVEIEALRKELEQVKTREAEIIARAKEDQREADARFVSLTSRYLSKYVKDDVVKETTHIVSVDTINAIAKAIRSKAIES